MPTNNPRRKMPAPVSRSSVRANWKTTSPPDSPSALALAHCVRVLVQTPFKSGFDDLSAGAMPNSNPLMMQITAK